MCVYAPGPLRRDVRAAGAPPLCCVVPAGAGCDGTVVCGRGAAGFPGSTPSGGTPPLLAKVPTRLWKSAISSARRFRSRVVASRSMGFQRRAPSRRDVFSISCSSDDVSTLLTSASIPIFTSGIDQIFPVAVFHVSQDRVEIEILVFDFLLNPVLGVVVRPVVLDHLFERGVEEPRIGRRQVVPAPECQLVAIRDLLGSLLRSLLDLAVERTTPSHEAP